MVFTRLLIVPVLHYLNRISNRQRLSRFLLLIV